MPGPANLDITITDLTTNTVLVHNNFPFSLPQQHITDPFVGTGNMVRLRIQESPESSFNDNEFIADNFDVEATTTPEPATFGLMGTVVAGLLALRLRRK